MDEFQIALGRVRIEDGVLAIDRPASDEIGRWRLFRWSVSNLAGHRPLYVGGYFLAFVILGGVFVWQLVDIYSANPAAAPIVVGLLLLGGVVVGGALEHAYRRGMRHRDELVSDLESSFDLRRPDRIPVGDITGVTIRDVNENGPFVTGTQFLVHFDRNGDRATTRLGIPGYMTEDIDHARSMFETHDIPVSRS